MDKWSLTSLMGLIERYKLRKRKKKKKEELDKILVRVDRLIRKTIYDAKKTLPYLRNVEFNDLYQTGVLGMIEAIQKMRIDEDPNKIPAWIKSYIILNIRKTYGRRGVDKEVSISEILDRDDEDVLRWEDFGIFIKIEKDRIYDMMDGHFLCESLYILLKEGKIKSEDMDLVEKKIFNGKTFEEIGKEYNLKKVVVWSRFQRAIRRIRNKLFCRRVK